MIGDEISSYCNKIMHSVETLQDILVKHLGIIDPTSTNIYSKTSFGDDPPNSQNKFSNKATLQTAFMDSHRRLSRTSQRSNHKDSPKVSRESIRRKVSRNTAFVKPEDDWKQIERTTKSYPSIPEVDPPN
jgi:hypothetical protein